MTKPGKRTTFTPIDGRDPSTVRAVILARVSDPNATDDTVKSQITPCEQFIARMGWRHCGTYADKRSGIYRVRREAFEEVEDLIRRREIDVVVVLNWERLDRRDDARKAAVYMAERYGVEYRFVEFKPDGKLANTPEAKAYAGFKQLFGEIQRDYIVANTQRGRQDRVDQGIPGGGSDGPPYGMRDATPEDAPLIRYAREDTEADRLLWMFQRVDGDERVTGRSLARELNARGWYTRRGKKWSNKTLLQKLHNPRYCGRGRINRWEVSHPPMTDEDTGKNLDVRRVRPRDPKQTREFAANMEPVLIPPDLFDRVQQKLAERAKNAGRLERTGSKYPADATLLHGPFIVCAGCLNQMSRAWRKDKRTRYAADPAPCYRCMTHQRDNAVRTCKAHSIPAGAVDNLVLRLLAYALTDPEQTLKVADAADAHARRAAAAAELAAVRLDAYREQLREIEQKRAKYERIIDLLDMNEDEEEIASYQAKLAALNRQRDRIEAEAHAAAPAHERANERDTMLRLLQEGGLVCGWFSTPDGRPSDDMTKFHPFRELKVWDARRMLGLPSLGELYNQRRVARGLDALDDLDAEWTAREKLVTYDEDADGNEVVIGSDTVSMAEVAFHLLRHVMPHAEVRRLLRNLKAVVEISHPRSPAERTHAGKTPLAERVAVYLMTEDRQPGQPVVGLRLQMPTARSRSATNGTPLV
jgi:DNA invertase Pin-like site-specific DNA recombinase